MGKEETGVSGRVKEKVVLFMVEVWEFSDALKEFNILRRKGDSMDNIFESLHALEQRALGVVA